MKVGILTWFFGYNYGAEAHSYALMKTIQHMGHDVELIDYRPRGSIKIDITSNMNVTNRKKHPFLLCRCLIRCIKFGYGKKRYNKSKKVRNAKEIEDLKYDVVILGSDEILNVKHQIHDKIYYGVGLEKVNCIFYAPSAGQTNTDEWISEEYIQSIKLKKFLSGRDFNTVSLLQKYSDKSVELVADPTLLYDFSEITVMPKQIDNYILIYAFSEWGEYKKNICEYARKYNLKIVSIRRYYSWVDYSFDMLDLNHWLGMFIKAKIVFTDSFHGLIFAIKNHKEFIVVSREDKVNKIVNFEEECGIYRPFMNRDISIDTYLKMYPIDYSIIDSNLQSIVDNSFDYLRKAILEEAL